MRYGASLEKEKAREREHKPNYQAPFGWVSDRRQEQIVADAMRGTTLQARELSECDLDTFNQLLWMQVALEEAKPIAQKHAEEKARRESDNQRTANAAMRNPQNRR